MNKVVERFNKLMNISIIMIILDIVVGAILLFYTEMASNIAMVIMGTLMVVHGLFCFINYFYDGLASRFFKIELYMGIIFLLLGILVILHPTTAIDFLGVGVGIWLFVSGCENLFYTSRFWKSNEEIAPLILFISVVAIIMGISTIFNPFSKFMLITKLVGLFTIANGALNIVKTILYKKRAKEILKIFK